MQVLVFGGPFKELILMLKGEYVIIARLGKSCLPDETSSVHIMDLRTEAIALISPPVIPDIYGKLALIQDDCPGLRHEHHFLYVLTVISRKKLDI